MTTDPHALQLLDLIREATPDRGAAIAKAYRTAAASLEELVQLLATAEHNLPAPDDETAQKEARPLRTARGDIREARSCLEMTWLGEILADLA